MYSTPFIMIVLFFMYILYNQINKYVYKKSKTVGLFKRAMVYRFVFSMMVTPTFRDIYAADYLTSFTKIIQDGVVGSCVLFTGEVFSESGSKSYMSILLKHPFPPNIFYIYIF